MKHTNFYNLCQEIQERSIEELKAAVKAYGGRYEFESDPKQHPDDYAPVISAEDDNGVFNFRVTSVELDAYDDLVIKGTDLNCNEPAESDGYNVMIGDLAYVIDTIPPVDGIDEVKACPLKIGQEVYWKDPDHGRSSGFYKVDEIPERWNEDTPIWISDGYSLAEVTIDELWIRPVY